MKEKKTHNRPKQYSESVFSVLIVIQLLNRSNEMEVGNSSFLCPHRSTSASGENSAEATGLNFQTQEFHIWMKELFKFFVCLSYTFFFVQSLL